LILTWTRSRPLARPCRAFAFSEFLSPLPKRLKSPPGRRNWVSALPVLRMGFRPIQPHDILRERTMILPLPGREGEREPICLRLGRATGCGAFRLAKAWTSGLTTHL